MSTTGGLFGDVPFVNRLAPPLSLRPVSEKQFLFLVGQTPFFALKVMRVLARRLRASNKAM
jgi:hypothetical protein